MQKVDLLQRCQRHFFFSEIKPDGREKGFHVSKPLIYCITSQNLPCTTKTGMLVNERLFVSTAACARILVRLTGINPPSRQDRALSQ
jgi:hypothetical protein